MIRCDTRGKSLSLYAKWNEIPKVAKHELGEATIDTWTDSIGSKWMKNDLVVGAKVGFSMTPFAFRSFGPEDVTSYEVYGYPTPFNW